MLILGADVNRHLLPFKLFLMENKIDPEVKKAIWKIILYVVTVVAGLFGGAAAADADVLHVLPQNDIEYVQE